MTCPARSHSSPIKASGCRTGSRAECAHARTHSNEPTPNTSAFGLRCRQPPALAPDRVLFNSDGNRCSFLEQAQAFLDKLPDGVPEGLIRTIDEKSGVLSVPVDDSLFADDRRGIDRQCPHLVWNHRWEYDKGPDRLAFPEYIPRNQLYPSHAGEPEAEALAAADRLAKLLANPPLPSCPGGWRVSSLSARYGNIIRATFEKHGVS
ncbi:DUF3524 domain-containing protein [Marinobacter sp. SS8-8]|uniref:tRNA-queuosine alpha-mannosyltransferase domain-containing protein n=1 Tax=Marinobacter sp. SS8-8 TaxID=3050452 RepID=UPI0026DEB30D|nr:DUF3524 domain-containing protein [Marinobacter sp. SS8-8]